MDHAEGKHGNINNHLQVLHKRGRERMKYMKQLDHERLQNLRNRHLKKITLLHSNDLHGDFLAEEVDSGLIGGVSMLSGYVSKVRNEEQNVLYAIAGDMFRGSLIDSEFRGISTIDIMNLLTPDVVTVGNHELDYGLSHLFFLERCANFPIINANMYVNLNGSHLFKPLVVLEAGGLKIMFIGVLTKDVLSKTRSEELIGTLIDISEAADEIRKVTEAYRTSDIDMTVLLTHIGFEEDKKLAAELGPDCNVDLIIGGHSHTFLEEPCVVAGIPIVQAAIGTNQIGRFDIVFDERSKKIDSYTWELIPVTEDNCPRDPALEELIRKYKEVTDAKYLRVLTRLAQKYTHPRRDMETDLGELLAGSVRSQLGVDIALIASGSIRGASLGPIVTLEDLLLVYPYESSIIGMDLTGAQLRKIMYHLTREDALDENVRTEWFQFSTGLVCEYDRGSGSILRLTLDGNDIQDDAVYRVAVQNYFFRSIDKFFGISHEEVEQTGAPAELAANSLNVLIEYFETHDYIKLKGEQRLLIHDKR